MGRQVRTSEYGPPESSITCLQKESTASSGLLRTSTISLGFSQVFMVAPPQDVSWMGDMPRSGAFPASPEQLACAYMTPHAANTYSTSCGRTRAAAGRAVKPANPSRSYSAELGVGEQGP